MRERLWNGLAIAAVAAGCMAVGPAKVHAQSSAEDALKRQVQSKRQDAPADRQNADAEKNASARAVPDGANYDRTRRGQASGARSEVIEPANNRSKLVRQY